MSLLPQAQTAMNITPFYHEGAQGSHRAVGDDVAQGFQSLIVVIFVAASSGHAAISTLLLVVKVITNYCQHL
jgi:hypothetical protein